ncbi:hypothetical protein NPIL_313521 [Nephila pilipes]|uniref:Uncharacterized protein n=1 Tax=Nephila pilipes TaxID=299642 RepID=A0A8X6PAA8_NEPPI|nr:hypothetical protein NPIL_313521 [Nephila pilipes]
MSVFSSLMKRRREVIPGEEYVATTSHVVGFPGKSRVKRNSWHFLGTESGSNIVSLRAIWVALHRFMYPLVGCGTIEDLPLLFVEFLLRRKEVLLWNDDLAQTKKSEGRN